MKEVLIALWMGIASFFGFVPDVDTLGGGPGTINQLDQWRATTSPVIGITQNVPNKTVILTGLTDGCLELESQQVTTTGAPCGSGGGGGSSNWTIIPGGLRTSTSTDFAQAAYFTATSTTGTSTLPNILTNVVKANTSAGLIFRSNSGSLIGDFGAGGGSNVTFNGGVNIDGTTRLATSLTGVLTATAGVVSTTSVGDVVGPASATDDAFARYNLTTGKLIQNSVMTLNDAGTAQTLSPTSADPVFNVALPSDVASTYNFNPTGLTTADFSYRFFRTTNTSGAVGVQVLQGNNTPAVQHYLRGNGTSYLAAQQGNLGVGLSSASAKLHVRDTQDAASVEVLRIEGDRATPATNDEIYQGFRLSDSAGNQDEFGRITVGADDITSTSEDGVMRFGVIGSGTLTNRAVLSSAGFYPNTTDGLTLGLSNRMWSDLFLASSGVINWNNGANTITGGTDLTVSPFRGVLFSNILNMASTSAVTDGSASTTEGPTIAGNFGSSERTMFLGIRNDSRFETGIFATSSNATATERTLGFIAHNQERMRITSAGNVGIGTTAPAYPLSVAGDVNITGALRFSNNAGTSGQILQSTGTGAQWVATSSLGLGSVTSVAASVPTGLTVTGSPITTSGTLAFNWDTGYGPVLTASSTNWNSFYNTPSTRIVDGDALTWSGNTLNFDGGNTPGGELGGTWASPTIDDSLAVTNWNLTSPTLTTFFGTPCTGNQFLQDISDTGAFTCATAAGGGGGLATTSPWTTGNLAYVTGNGTVGSAPTTTLVAGTNISFSGGTPVVLGSSPITINATAGGGSGDTAWATSTLLDGAIAQYPISPTVDVLFGGSSTATAGFWFDRSASTTKLGNGGAGDSLIELAINSISTWIFGADDSTTNDDFVISRGGVLGTANAFSIQGVSSFLVNVFGNLFVQNKLSVATSTYYGATTTDAIVSAGYINSGEWIEEHCTTPTAETTQVVADTLRGCGRYAYLEDAAGAIDFVVPTTGTSTYFNIQPGATGAANAAGDGMGIGWASGLDFGDIQRHEPAMEFAIRQDQIANATATIVVAGITDKIGVSADFATEPGQGMYVISTSTTANYQLACNPSTGNTTFVDTGIASSTTATANQNPFTHFRLEVSGTSNTAVTAILKARTWSNRDFTHVGSCTINTSASTQAVAPTVAIGKGGAGTASDLHAMFIKFWYKQPVF